MFTLKRVACMLLVGCVGLTAWSTVAAAGTLDLIPDEAWARPLSNAEMADLRGGFRGIAFSAFVTVENLTTDLSGTLSTGAPPPSVTATNDQVQIQTVVGNFVGTSGIFQIAQVPGDFNIVNNNLFVQIFVGELNVPAPSIFGLAGQ